MNNDIAYRRQKMIETADNKAFHADLELRRLEIQRDEITNNIRVLEDMRTAGSFCDETIDNAIEMEVFKAQNLIRYYKLLKIKLQAAKMIVKVAQMIGNRS